MNERRSGVYQTGVLAEGLTMGGGVEQVISMVSGNYGTGRRRVT